MKRKEKNDLLKMIAMSLDETLATAKGLKPELAATLITYMQMIDEKFNYNHTSRHYHELIRKGEIKLEKIVE